LTSEEVTARRRAERKQFKLNRAHAIAAVAEEAEVIFAREGRVIQPALSGPAIPSTATWKPSAHPVVEDSMPETPQKDGDLNDEEPLLDVEHLQLTLQEAFFLLWNLDCLTVLDPDSVRFLIVSPKILDPHLTISKLNPMSLHDIWLAFQRDLPPVIPPSPLVSLQFAIPHQLCRLSPLPFARMGNGGWYQILRRLPAIQKRSGLYTCRVISNFFLHKYLLTFC